MQMSPDAHSPAYCRNARERAVAMMPGPHSESRLTAANVDFWSFSRRKVPFIYDFPGLMAVIDR